MNFLSHAVPHLDQPWVIVGTALPDWLSVLDRRVRARARLARPWLESDDEALRQVAGGVIRHHEDDRWFHGTRAFAETNLQLAVELRERLPGDDGFRPSFVGHILIEILLDACWIEEDRRWADRFYQAIDSVPPERVEGCAEAITGRPVPGLGELVRRFVDARFLYDYLDHDKLLFRLNQVMRRVGLAELPPAVRDWLPEAAETVQSRRVRLLSPPDGPSPFPLPPVAEPDRETNR